MKEVRIECAQRCGQVSFTASDDEATKIAEERVCPQCNNPLGNEPASDAHGIKFDRVWLRDLGEDPKPQEPEVRSSEDEAEDTPE